MTKFPLTSFCPAERDNGAFVDRWADVMHLGVDPTDAFWMVPGTHPEDPLSGQAAALSTVAGGQNSLPALARYWANQPPF